MSNSAKVVLAPTPRKPMRSRPMSLPMKLLRRHAVLAAAFFLLSVDAFAQNKKDISGFYPGMNENDFSVRVKETNLTCRAAVLPEDPIYCELQNEQEEQISGKRQVKGKPTQFYFTRTRFVSPALVWRIAYYFFSGETNEELVSEISSTYGMRPSFTQPKGREATYDWVCQEYAAPAAVWKLAAGVLMLENWERYIVRNSISMSGWELLLCDEGLLEADKRAFEQNKREVGPPKRF
jgi:hypothetical protein